MKLREYAKLLNILSEYNPKADEPGSVFWVANNGTCSVKSLDSLIEGRGPPCQKFDETWHVKSPLKVKAFMWLVYHKRIITKDLRYRWNSDGDLLCILCGKEEENADHLPISCELSKEVWYIVGKIVGFQANFSDIQQMWHFSHELK